MLSEEKVTNAAGLRDARDFVALIHYTFLHYAFRSSFFMLFNAFQTWAAMEQRIA